MTVTARTVTIIRMLGLRFCNGDERRGDGGVNELVTVGNVLVFGSMSDPTTFSDKGGGEAIGFGLVLMLKRERQKEEGKWCFRSYSVSS